MNMISTCPFRPQPNAQAVAPALPDAELGITVHLLPEVNEEQQQQQMTLLADHPQRRKYLAGNSLKAHCSSGKDVLNEVMQFFKDHGVAAVSGDRALRLVTATLTVEKAAELFGISFYIYRQADAHQYLSYEGSIQLPPQIAPYVTHISGLTRGKQRAVRSRIRLDDTSAFNPALFAAPDQNAPQGYTPQHIEQVYQFPDNDAEGECIGLIELGGHYRKEDLQTYCDALGIPLPDVAEVGEAPGGASADPTLSDLEVTMDLQLAAGLAPGAKLVIYYAATIADALQLAITDNQHKPSILSISWAVGESDISDSELMELQYLTQQASLRGITIVAASGDHGYLEVNQQVAGVNYPAALPHVLGVGGTALWGDNSQTVWDQMQQSLEASGGGYSRKIPAPPYQSSALYHYQQYNPQMPVTVRATPDLAANASAQTAYAVVFNGHWFAMGAGTSASTPVMAALFARLNKALGYRLGFIHHFLYQLMATPTWNSAIAGNNGGYTSAPGWDPCTGLGAPNGTLLLDAFRAGEEE